MGKYKETSLGHKVEYLREEKGLSKKGLADLVGVTPIHISKIEEGVSDPKLSVVVRIALVLEKPIEYFFSGEIENIELPERKLDYDLVKIISGQNPGGIDEIERYHDIYPGLFSIDYSKKKQLFLFISHLLKEQ